MRWSRRTPLSTRDQFNYPKTIFKHAAGLACKSNNWRNNIIENKLIRFITYVYEVKPGNGNN